MLSVLLDGRLRDDMIDDTLVLRIHHPAPAEIWGENDMFPRPAVRDGLREKGSGKPFKYTFYIIHIFLLREKCP